MSTARSGRRIAAVAALAAASATAGAMVATSAAGALPRIDDAMADDGDMSSGALGDGDVVAGRGGVLDWDPYPDDDTEVGDDGPVDDGGVVVGDGPVDDGGVVVGDGPIDGGGGGVYDWDPSGDDDRPVARRLLP